LRPRNCSSPTATTALDVTVQAQILRLLASLKREFGLVDPADHARSRHRGAAVADRVSVMYAGEVSRARAAAQWFSAPQHLHARAAVLRAGARKVRRDRPLGSIPHGADHSARLAGCAFRSRCAHADETCARRDSTPAGGAGARLLWPADAARN